MNYNSTSDTQFTNLQSQVNDVKDVMKTNIDKVLQRGDRLDDLVDKTTDLEANAVQFTTVSKKIKRKMWWQNLKMKIILVCVILVIIAIITVALILKFKKSDDTEITTTTAKPTITTSLK
ncbi:vesicle-associated membrane 7-like [Brachionus plicatilis]|uniref:Vesicle-associated membrane 7-like n=1 Tax=Brachionus plicatilis TaxID=10195 RepID=A0A3M7SHA3_BRAPC|nr:vesicle-associated membrane 7-like [Brachionus plicatilis]